MKMNLKEVEVKLKSKNPAYISYVLSNVAKVIEEKQTETATRKKHIQEVKFLEKKCVDQNILVSLTASKTLLKLIHNRILQKEKVLFDLISLLPSALSYEGLCYVVNEIILLHSSSDQSFQLWDPQNPLVTILQKNSKCSIQVFNNISQTYKLREKETCRLNDLYEAVYIYWFCNPQYTLETKEHWKIWNLLLKKTSSTFVFRLINFMQLQNADIISNIVDLLIQFLEECILKNEVDCIEYLVIILSSLLNDFSKNQISPLNITEAILASIKYFNHFSTRNIVLMLISSSLHECPVNYLPYFLDLCENLINDSSIYELPIRCIQIPLFNWILLKNDLTEIERLKKLIKVLESKVSEFSNSTKILTENCDSMMKNFVTIHYRGHVAVEFFNVYKSIFECDEKNIFDWIKKISSTANETLLKECLIYIMSFVLFRTSDEIVFEKLIEITVSLVEKYSYSTLFLSTVMYKLSISTNPNMNLILLKCLPKLVVCRENVSFVVHTLKSLDKGPIPAKTFVMTQFFEMWKIDSRYYGLLQNMLSKSSNIKTLDEDLEVNVTKAWILKEICKIKPELYGSELVSYLSEILNKCGKTNGSLPSALSIDGISILCKAGIVDIFSTWKELSPKFKSDERSQVLISFCQLLSTVPNYFEETERYTKLLEDVTTTLWEFSMLVENPEVNRAAYESLSYFKIEDISKTLPDKYKTNISQEMSGFGLVSGECWINILKDNKSNNLDAAGYLFTKLIEIEISEFRSGTYHVSEKEREPQNYNYLSVYSVLRAVANFVKLNIQNWKNPYIQPVFLQCLKILTHEYQKPLPPLDWCFLQELVHYEEAKLLCITVASHQVRLSGTARRFMENILTVLTPQNSLECMVVYKNLKFLCNSIQPSILKPFIQLTLEYCAHNYEETEDFFHSICKNLKVTLSMDDIHDVNRRVLSLAIVGVIKSLETNSKSFETLLDTASVLSEEYVSEFNLDNASEKSFLLFLKVRVIKTLHATSDQFYWMKDVFRHYDYTEKEQKIILQELFEIIKQYKKEPCFKDWILELMLQIQMLEKEVTETILRWFCKTLVVSFIFASDFDLLVKDSLEIIATEDVTFRLFPHSVYSLVRTELWDYNISQVLEWLYKMSYNHFIPSSYQIAFHRAVIALRSEKSFSQKYIWMKCIKTSKSYTFKKC